MSTLLIGTRNRGKLEEIKDMLSTVQWEFRTLDDYPNAGTPEEDGDTYTANAIAKARYYAAVTGLWSFADDSGLEVADLNGAPGLHSARYAGEGASDAERRLLLLGQLSRVVSAKRRARFVCVIAIATPDQDVVNVAEGYCEGVISVEPRGESGFGYDPIFIPEGYEQTFAQLPRQVKNRISHRARALLHTRQFLIEQGKSPRVL